MICCSQRRCLQLCLCVDLCGVLPKVALRWTAEEMRRDRPEGNMEKGHGKEDENMQLDMRYHHQEGCRPTTVAFSRSPGVGQ